MDALHRRAEKAWTDASLHHSALRECYYWFCPERYYEMVGAPGQSSNSRAVYDHIFDPVGMQALEDGASQIAEALHPWDQEWSRWVPKKDIPDELRKQVEQASDGMSDICSSLLSRSNFDAAAPVAHKEFLIGTAFMLLDRDARDPMRIRFTPTPAYQWAIEADSAGRITAAFHKVRSKARDLDATVPGGKWSDQARQQQEQQPEAQIELMMAIWWDQGGRRWLTCVYEAQTKHEAWQQASRTCPVLIYRQGLIAGQAWGRGPALKALPDVKTANKVAELVLKNAAIAVTGIWQADDDGVLNPHTIRLVPGAIIPKAQGSNGLQPLQPAGNFDVSQLVLEDLRVNVRRAMYVTRVEERDMTAEEYRGRLNQQLREQRGMYGPLKCEFADQVMFRLFDLAEQMREIPESAFPYLAEVELTGPLAMDVRGAEVERFKQTYYDLAGTVGPEVAMASVAIEKLPEWIAEQRHAPSELFRNEAQMKGLVQQMMGMVAQQQAAATGAAPAPANAA